MPSIAARSATVETFHRIAEADSRIIAAFLGGSLASGIADQYSDIDMYYVIDPSEYESFHSTIRSLIDGLGPVAFFDEHNNFGFDLVLFMLTNGTKGELVIGTPDKLKVMHAGPFKVLVDKEGILKDAQFPYEKMLDGEALRKDIEKQLRMYWYWYGIVFTAVA
jgi:predicted nucleotidyltransferase